MKLFYSTTSPFARKTAMILRLSGLHSQTEYVITNPLADPELRELNPLGKVPALKEGETVLFDSTLICEYLDKKANCDLHRRQSNHYFSIQQTHFLANGIIEAAVNIMFELRRETEHSTFWIDRWNTSLDTALGQLEKLASESAEALGGAQDPHIATIAVAAALGYLDFRHPKRDWRRSSPALAKWLKPIEEKSWFLDTSPE